MSAQYLLERNLPLHCRTAAALPAHHAAMNQLAFAMLAALEEPTAPCQDSETHGELARLDMKLNLILQLLSQLLHKDVVLPAVQPVRFASDALAWPAGELQTGDAVICELYLDAEVPVPVIVQGPIQRVDQQWARLELLSLTQEQQAGWSRWVFRQHRRDVARQRQPHKV